MRWLIDLINRRRWRFVGAASTVTKVVDRDGNAVPGGISQGYFLLFERGDGKRKFRLIGTEGDSQSAAWTRAKVEIWVLGGDLPPLDPDFTAQKKQGFAKLIVFNGGKK